MGHQESGQDQSSLSSVAGQSEGPELDGYLESVALYDAVTFCYLMYSGVHTAESFDLDAGIL